MASSPTFNPRTTIGALELGVFMSCALFGLETMQSYIYFVRFAADPLRLKILVASVWILETGHLVCISKSLYSVSVTDYGKQSLRLPDSLAISLLFAGVILVLVQGFFAWRIYRATRAVLVPALCAALTLLRLLGFVALSVLALSVARALSWAAEYSWLLDSLWAVSSANDILLAVATTYTLFRPRPDPAHQRATPLVDQILQWTVENGLLTCVTGLVVLITFATARNKYIWIATYCLTTKLYSNAFFATLNSRIKSRDTCADRDVVLSDIHAPELRDNPRAMLAPMAFAPPPPAAPSQTQLDQTQLESQCAGAARRSRSRSRSLSHDAAADADAPRQVP